MMVGYGLEYFEIEDILYRCVEDCKEYDIGYIKKEVDFYLKMQDKYCESESKDSLHDS